MGTILASATIASARVTLLDPSPGKTFDAALLLDLYNAALRRLVAVKKDVYPIKAPIGLVEGSEQVLPVGGVIFLKGIRNEASGKPVNAVVESLLVEGMRFRTSPTMEVDVESYAVDGRDPTRFLVSPPNDGTGFLVTLYGGTPTVASAATAIPIDDHYEPALRFLLLAQAYEADTDRQSLAKTQQFEQRAMGLLGMGEASTDGKKPRPGLSGES